MPKTKKTKKPMTAGQKKLTALGCQLPPLPLTTVGSFPKQSELIEMKYRVSKGFQNPAELQRKERLSIDHWIREQENLNLDILVDGEMEKADMITFFAEKIDGYDRGGIVRCYGNRYFRKPIIKQKLAWKAPLILDSWRISQRSTHRPLKAVLTGPYTLLDWSFNEYYNRRETALEDIVKIMRKEIEMLVDAGAKIIQFDDPAISSRPHEFSLVIDAIKELTKGLNCYFILHHCYGNIAPIWAKMQRLPVDNFDLETTNSNFSLLPLLKKIPTKKDMTIGLIESHRHEVESPATITNRLKIAMKYIPLSQLWISPDCGLKTRTTGETRQKLQTLTKTIIKARERLPK